MIRFVNLGGRWYGLELDENRYFISEDEEENILTLISEGNIVVLADNVEDFCNEMSIDEEELTIVKEGELE